MAITAQDVNKLRQMTGAGMMDCKKALTEANGDFDAAVDALRKRGQAIASKRADREVTEGACIAKVDASGKYGAAIKLSCETDFVATNAQFVDLAKQVLDIALAQKPADLAALQAIVADEVTRLSGVIGEKIAVSEYKVVEGESVTAYIHMNNKIAVLVALNQAADAQVGKNIGMQVASMSPIAVDAASVSQETIDRELKVAVEKTKDELVKKAVDAALNKAGINPAHVDTDEHIESNTAKGWLTPEQAQQARDIKTTEAEKAAANIKEQMVQNIAQGRLKKFFKDSCLMEQEYCFDSKQTISQYLTSVSKDLKATAFCRLSLKD
ncbi:MAG: translation elongation factor Ts [Bacteroidales bacterium]|nr:translation elongation factor Ts [Bacteroidales bacterium]